MKKLKYFEILSRVKELRDTQSDKPSIHIRILSNCIVHQLLEVLEYALRNIGIVPQITLGNYDNILQDAAESGKNEIIIVFWEATNIVDGFQYKCGSFSEKKLADVFNKIESEFLLLTEALGEHKQVFFNLFHSYPFSNNAISNSANENFIGKLNLMVRKQASSNFVLVDTHKMMAELGITCSFDLRNFYSSKAPYTIEFFKKYTESLIPALRSITGKVKKVLVLDCDNTLWKGILGEDGKEGIEMSSRTKGGIPFETVQYKIKALARKGVLVCLCSKNNQQEVEEVLQNHKDMILKEEDIVAKKIDWKDKAANLRAISEELNLGLDSFVFMDDSDFEVNLIKEHLPEVTVFQVPKKLYQYPELINEVEALFYNPFQTDEDRSKSIQYKSQEKRARLKSSINNIDEYIRNLGIKIWMYKNDESLVPRMAQMTQKTNQFNLTTKRYSESEVLNFVNDKSVDVYAISVSDKYGDSGVTGLAIVHLDSEFADIDSFLMSCRIIGRNIEYRFLEAVITDIQQEEITCRYARTEKNTQAANFYDKAGFNAVDKTKNEKVYIVQRQAYETGQYNYIELDNGGQN